VDSRGNRAAPASFVVTVRDTTPPTLGVPKSVTKEATSAAGAVLDGLTVTATDLVDGTVTPHCNRPPNGTYAIGTHTVTCTATDRHGNISKSGSFTIVVQDTTPPALKVPASVSTEATGAEGALVTGLTVTATDLVDGPVTPTCTPRLNGIYSLGTHTVTCTAKDKRGNSAEMRFTVTVRDTAPPSWVGTRPDIAVNEGAVANFGAPIANDRVDGRITATCDHRPGVYTQTTTVTCTATDKSKNSSSLTFRIIVNKKPTVQITNERFVVIVDSDSEFTLQLKYDTFVEGDDTPVCSPKAETLYSPTLPIPKDGFKVDVTCTVTAAGQTGSDTKTVTYVPPEFL
jgi:hypothetical protein